MLIIFEIVLSIIFAFIIGGGAWFFICWLMRYFARDEFMDDYALKLKFKKEMKRQAEVIEKKDDFTTVYNKFVEIMKDSNINNMKDECKNNNRSIILICISCIIVILGVIAVILCRPIENILKIYPILLLLIILITILITVIIDVINKPSKYKVDVAKNFLTSIDSDIKYENSFENILDVHKICEDIYIPSGFRDSNSDITKVTDYMEYNVARDRSVKIATLHLEKHTKGKRKRVHHIYDGFIAKMTRERYIENEILIERKKRFKHENMVNDLSDEFEKYFDVYAKSGTNVHSILSQSVQEQLVSLYKEYGTMFEISLKGNNIFIRFFNGGLFESIVYSRNYSKENLYREYIIFTNILEIIKKISEIL